MVAKAVFKSSSRYKVLLCRFFAFKYCPWYSLPTMNDVITPVNTSERVKLGIRSGDTVRVDQKIIEKGKTRIQAFEGLVIAVKHGTEAGATFTVRAMMSGVGVEKIFPLYAPFIEKITITRRSKVRRAKLYFIREKVAREVRRQLRNMRLVKISTDDFKEEPVLATDEDTAMDTDAANGADMTTDITSDMEDNAPILIGTPETPEEIAAAEEVEAEVVAGETQTPNAESK
jgi:large subunit ribosomal protein L19